MTNQSSAAVEGDDEDRPRRKRHRGPRRDQHQLVSARMGEHGPIVYGVLGQRRHAQLRRLVRLAVRLLRRRVKDAKRVELPRITVRELLDHGLGKRPDAAGIYWPDSQVTVCRSHVEDGTAVHLLDAVRHDTDEAMVLGANVAEKMRQLCSLRHGL